MILQHLCDYSDFRMVVLDRNNPTNRQRSSYPQRVDRDDVLPLRREALLVLNPEDKVPHDVGGIFSIGICTIFVC